MIGKTRVGLVFFIALHSMVLLSYADEKDVSDIEKVFEKGISLFQAGEYEEAVFEFKNILSIDPDHEESADYILLCDEKTNLTKEFVNDGIRAYIGGFFEEALEQFEYAYAKDPKNYKVKSLMTKVLIELGMQKSIKAEYSKALSYFEKAEEITPGDETIRNLIKSNRSRLISKSEIVSKKSKNPESGKIEKMLSLFSKYREEQKKLMLDYSATQIKIEEMRKSSEKKINVLTGVIEEKEKLIEEAIKKKKNKGIIIFNYLLVIILLICSGMLIYSIKKMRNIEMFNRENTCESVDVSKLSDTSDIGEYDRKLKKLAIIRSEFAGKDLYDNKVALDMLEEFLDDKDHRIRLKVLQIIHDIDPASAADILKKIIGNGNIEYKLDACSFMGELESPEIVRLMLELMDSVNERLKECIGLSLTKIYRSKKAAPAIRKQIKYSLDNMNKKNKWIV